MPWTRQGLEPLGLHLSPDALVTASERLGAGSLTSPSFFSRLGVAVRLKIRMYVKESP